MSDGVERIRQFNLRRGAVAGFKRDRNSPTRRSVIRNRMLRVLRSVGPLKRTVLRGVALGTPEQFDAVLEQLLREGRIVKIGDRKATKYGLR